MKYFLALLWLLCYFPFIDSFVEDQNQKVTIYLENLQSFDNDVTYQQWQSCLSFLEENNINCCIRMNCQDRNLDDPHFKRFIRMLEIKGNHILHSEHCYCGKSVQLNYRESFSESRLVSQSDLEPTVKLSLPISLDPFSFKNQFQSLAKKCDVLLIKGDPSIWNQDHFKYFKENIEFLVKVGIRFDLPQPQQTQ